MRRTYVSLRAHPGAKRQNEHAERTRVALALAGGDEAKAQLVRMTPLFAVAMDGYDGLMAFVAAQDERKAA